MTTDPRFARSAQALADAVLELAAERSIEQVSVTEIARAAGVTRATFYNHAASPAALLTRVLEAELDQILADFLARTDSGNGDVETVWRGSELELIEHILSHRAVYTQDLTGAQGSVLGQMIARHIETGLHTFALTMPGRESEDPLRLSMAAAFVAQGTVGALRAWLVGGGSDARYAADTILGLIPRLWFELAHD